MRGQFAKTEKHADDNQTPVDFNHNTITGSTFLSTPPMIKDPRKDSVALPFWACGGGSPERGTAVQFTAYNGTSGGELHLWAVWAEELSLSMLMGMVGSTP